MANHIQELREGLGLEKKDLANKIYCSLNHIYVIEKQIFNLDNTKHYSILKRVSDVFQCKPEDLINPEFSVKTFLAKKYLQEESGDIIPKFQPQNPDRIKTEDLAKHGEYFPDEESNTLSIPFIEAKACCGNGIMDFDHAIKFKLALSLIDNILNTKILPEDVKSNRYFFISAEGDSMQPFIESGDALMIDTNIKIIPQHRQILLVEDAGNRKMLREFCYLTGNKYRVRAYNKEYESYDKVSYEYIVNEIFGGSLTIIGGLVPISIGRFKYPDVEALSRNVIVPK